MDPLAISSLVITSLSILISLTTAVYKEIKGYKHKHDKSQDYHDDASDNDSSDNNKHHNKHHDNKHHNKHHDKDGDDSNSGYGQEQSVVEVAGAHHEDAE
ncbi:MAG: hypothetical protein H0U78_01770 [Rickettsiaceae bacterium]|nr:hypothetical protein [Rickettsiaceae bacterium]